MEYPSAWKATTAAMAVAAIMGTISPKPLWVSSSTSTGLGGIGGPAGGINPADPVNHIPKRRAGRRARQRQAPGHRCLRQWQL
jgi:hypothetical protein